MVRKFPEFSRFSLIFFKKSLFQVFQVFPELYEPWLSKPYLTWAFLELSVTGGIMAPIITLLLLLQ